MNEEPLISATLLRKFGQAPLQPWAGRTRHSVISIICGAANSAPLVRNWFPRASSPTL